MADASGISWIGDEPEFYRELVSILLEVARIPSPSGAEVKMTNHCSYFLHHCGFSVEQDEFGNIMATRGTSPSGKYVLLNAHMDTHIVGSVAKCYRKLKNDYAQELEARGDELLFQYNSVLTPQRKALVKAKAPREEIRAVEEQLDSVRAEFAKVRDAYEDPLRGYEYVITGEELCWIPEDIVYHPKKRIVLATKESGMYVGGDDKAGVAIILMLAAQTVHPCKVLLTTHEEMPFATQGGSRQIPASFYSDVSVSFTLDRRGGGDLINEISRRKMCSTKLVRLIAEHGGGCMALYRATDGLMADAMNIARFVPAVNMSVGYYNPHSVGDYIFVPETFRAACVVENSLVDLTNNYTDYEQFRYVPPVEKRKRIVSDHGSAAVSSS
jgi:hypothetical protein